MLISVLYMISVTTQNIHHIVSTLLSFCYHSFFFHAIEAPFYTLHSVTDSLESTEEVAILLLLVEKNRFCFSWFSFGDIFRLMVRTLWSFSCLNAFTTEIAA